jgi:Zn-dependent peptidase ImmA (M78 family)
VLDLAISWEEIPGPDAERILGFLDVADRRVVINEGFRERYERVPGSLLFTLAHEAGHYELHVDHGGYQQASLLLTPEEEPALCRDGSYDVREVQANRFAAFLLLPEELLRPAAAGHDCRLDGAIRELATTFAVSNTTMRIRLERLRMIPSSTSSARGRRHA